MKNILRIMSAVLATVLLCTALLTGCTVPKIQVPSIPSTAATYGDGQSISTGEYLAYLYLEFENIYYNQDLYQYEAYGMDPWAQTFPYGESEEKLALSDYIIRATQDNISRQIVLTQMMKDYNLSWIEEDLKTINENLASMQVDAYLPLGFNNDSYAVALKNANLNERAAFYGLYGKGGQKEIAETELKKYFAENYLSYKSISIALTDNNGKELDKKGEAYKKLVALMDGYMETYKKDGFLAAYEQYEKDSTVISDIKKSATATTAATTATTTTVATTTVATTTTTAAATTTAGETATTTTAAAEKEEEHDHELRQDVDSTTIDEALKDAIVGKKDKDGKVEQEGIKVGECKIVEYKASGSTPTLSMIERLDINKDDEGKEGTVYENAVENIIYELKYEEFDKEVDAALAQLTINFDSKVVDSKKCKPEQFLEIINNL